MRLTDGHELRMNFGENGILTAEERRKKPSKTDDEQRANKEERGPLIMTSNQERTKKKIIIEARVKPEKVTPKSPSCKGGAKEKMTLQARMKLGENQTRSVDEAWMKSPIEARMKPAKFPV